MKRMLTVILLTMLLTVIAITAYKKQIKSVTTTTIEGVVRTIKTETFTETVKTTTTAQSEAETTTEATTYTTTTQQPINESVEITPEQFKRQGVVYADGFKWTWYSERVLPGRGLNIPGRYSDGNYVRDGEGYIVLASRDLKKGDIIDTPFGRGKVYDYCPTSGVIDVYVSW